MRHTRNLAGLALAGLLATVLAGCSLGNDGAAVGRDEAEGYAEQLLAHLDNSFEVHDAEYLAADLDPGYRSPDWSTVTTEALAWNGVTNEDPGAVIDVRYTVRVQSHSLGKFGPTVTAGTGIRCYRFSVLFNFATMEEFDCPDGSAPTQPEPAPLLRLPDDASDRLAAVLAAASAATLEADVHAAFPEEYLLIETDAAEGRLIVAMRAAINNECLLMLRDVDGTVGPGGFDPIWAQQGELGCSTRLITNPPL